MVHCGEIDPPGVFTTSGPDVYNVVGLCLQHDHGQDLTI